MTHNRKPFKCEKRKIKYRKTIHWVPKNENLSEQSAIPKTTRFPFLPYFRKHNKRAITSALAFLNSNVLPRVPPRDLKIRNFSTKYSAADRIRNFRSFPVRVSKLSNKQRVQHVVVSLKDRQCLVPTGKNFFQVAQVLALLPVINYVGLWS